MADIIISSLLVDQTPVPRKLARLHLICDILHNSAAAVPSAWRFRQEFQSRLGIVFDHFASIYHSFPGRITADVFKKQITTVVDIWEDWIVFPPDFTSDLRQRLDGPKSAAAPSNAEEEAHPDSSEIVHVSKFKTSSFHLATSEDPRTGDEDLDGAPMDNEDLDGTPMDDVDGTPLDDVDGEAMDDVDGEPMDDLDGEPMNDMDGEPMEDLDGEGMVDVDGEPILQHHKI